MSIDHAWRRLALHKTKILYYSKQIIPVTRLSFLQRQQQGTASYSAQPSLALFDAPFALVCPPLTISS